MSLYEKATLVQIPSGYKASSAKLYSVLPTDGDGDFTISADADATRVNSDGLIESVSANQARLNYDPSNPQDPHLLLEPTRTNLMQRSEEFDNSYWTKARSSITADQTTSPDGSNTADKLIDSTDNNTHIVYRSFTVSTSNAYTFSCFLKKGSLSKAFLAFDAAIGQTVVFDLENGTVESEGTGVTSSSIIEYSNDWYKCSLTHTPTTTTRLYRIGTYNGNISYTGTGTDFVYLWGSQLEVGTYPTSYIPTSGSAVTRTQDSCLNAGNSNVFNNTEGVLFGQISRLETPATNEYWLITINDNTSSNVVAIGFNHVNGNLYGRLKSANATQFENTSTASTIGQSYKLAVRYSSTEAAFFIDGVKKQTISNPTAFTGTLSRLDFRFGGGTSPFYGKNFQLMYFNEALSDAELITLTS